MKGRVGNVKGDLKGEKLKVSEGFQVDDQTFLCMKELVVCYCGPHQRDLFQASVLKIGIHFWRKKGDVGNDGSHGLLHRHRKNCLSAPMMTNVMTNPCKCHEKSLCTEMEEREALRSGGSGGWSTRMCRG